MHELSLAMDLLRQIEIIAAEQKVTKIHNVTLHVGAQKLVVPDAMQEAFRAACRGTVADGAELVIVEIEAVARCNVCRTSFKPKIDDYRCPTCLEADITFTQGNDIILASMDCEVDQRRYLDLHGD